METTIGAAGPGRLSSVIASAAVIGWAVVLGIIHRLGASLDTPHIDLSSVAFGAPFLAAGAATLVGEVRRAPWIVAAGGLALIPMSLLTFSPVALPLLIPASFLLAHGLAPTEAWPRSALLAVTALAALILHDDPAEWQASDGSQRGASDIITASEAVLSLALSTSVIAVATIAPPRGFAGDSER